MPATRSDPEKTALTETRPKTPVPRKTTLFFCIGAQKAGTTWLYDFLQKSADCHFCRNKELHYFDVLAGQADLALEIRVKAVRTLADQLRQEVGPANRKTLTRLKEAADLLTIYTGREGKHGPYLRYLLQGWSGQKLICDITPSYAIVGREILAGMAGLEAGVGKPFEVRIQPPKFLFILRDPVSRLWSQMRMAVANQKRFKADADAGTLGDAYDAACVTHAEGLIGQNHIPRMARGNYARTLADLDATVPAERWRAVFYENLFSQDGADEICDFLDIARLSADGARRVNEGRRVPIPPAIERAFFDALRPQYDAAAARFGDALPEAWQERRARLGSRMGTE